jgi:hypothetical protein
MLNAERRRISCLALFLAVDGLLCRKRLVLAPDLGNEPVLLAAALCGNSSSCPDSLLGMAAARGQFTLFVGKRHRRERQRLADYTLSALLIFFKVRAHKDTHFCRTRRSL